jgi:molybdopterin converting factor small subunit
MDKVSITVYGNLKKSLGKDTTVAAGQTTAQAVESLGLGSAGGLPLTPMVNDKVVTWDYVLQPGDKLTLLPTIGGGC